MGLIKRFDVAALEHRQTETLQAQNLPLPS